MAGPMAFLLFGDQSLDIHDSLSDFYRRPSNGVLSKSFLERACTALQEEVDRLPNIDRLRIPTFSSIQDLNEKYHAASQKNSAMDGALLCITQLALYIE
jgi:hypothetical protein